MSAQHVCVLLAILGGALVLLSWVGRQTGDALRDVALMFAVGAFLSVSSAALYVLA